MNIFDIMGPIMVGPSSSHTAGAARIGFLTRRLLGSTPRRAELLLHGSFAATGTGHGTDRALVAGLLGMRPDDARLPRSFELAEAAGMELTLGRAARRRFERYRRCTAVLRRRYAEGTPITQLIVAA